MKNKKTGFITKLLILIGSCFLLASFSPSLDGRAVVVDEGVFPQGLFAKTVGYVPGDTICVTNVAGDKNVDILVIGALDPSEGVAIMLSPEAAAVLGIEKDQNNIVKITKRTGQDERVFGTAVIAPEEDEPEIDESENAVEEEDLADTEDESETELDAEADASEETFQDNPISQNELEEETLSDDSEMPVEEESIEADDETLEEESAEEEVDEAEESEEEESAEEPLEESIEEAVEEDLEDTEEESVEENTDEEIEEESVESEELDAVEPETEEEDEPVDEESVETEDLEETEEETPVETEAVEIEDEFADLPEIEEKDEFAEGENDLGSTSFEIEGEDEEVIELGTTYFEAPEDEAEEESEEVIEEDVEEEYDAIVLIPAESNPPAPLEEEEVESVEASPVAEETPSVEPVKEVIIVPEVKAPAVKETSYEKYMVNDMSCLEKGKYYVQIAALGSDANIMAIVNKYAEHYPITIVPTGKNNVKVVLIGALTMDEYKVVLERFKSYGYKDAFLRKIK